tara:strand:+ start:3807 stop:4409 length:603 start_codon:yes stop_codon:yes gene_type:complete
MEILRKIPHETCAEILERANLSEEALAIVNGDMSPYDVSSALMDAAMIFDICQFWPHALPTRESLCWAVACLESAPQGVKDTDVAALTLVSEWILDPQEGRRQTALKMVDDLKGDTSGHWLCQGLVWNGSGSIVPPGTPTVLPAPYLHAKALYGAVALSTPIEEAEFPEMAKRLHTLGLEIAQGGWPIKQARKTTQGAAL